MLLTDNQWKFPENQGRTCVLLEWVKIRWEFVLITEIPVVFSDNTVEKVTEVSASVIEILVTFPT